MNFNFIFIMLLVAALTGLSIRIVTRHTSKRGLAKVIKMWGYGKWAIVASISIRIYLYLMLKI